MTPTVPARPVLSGEGERMVSLREFEQRTFSLQQQISDQIRFQRELVDTRAIALEKALDLARIETERRLDDLNHAHKNAVENWRQSLPREVFEATLTEWLKWRDTINQHVTTLATIPQHISSVDGRVKTLETHSASRASIPQELGSIEARVQSIENLGNKVAGALILIGFMGMAGVLALAMSLLRLAGIIN